MHQKVFGKVGRVREKILARSLFARNNLSPETPGRKDRQKFEGGATRGAVHSTGSPSVPRQTITKINANFGAISSEVERGAS